MFRLDFPKVDETLVQMGVVQSDVMASLQHLFLLRDIASFSDSAIATHVPYRCSNNRWDTCQKRDKRLLALVKWSLCLTVSRTESNRRETRSPAWLRQFMALGRYGKADDIANAVAFLASAKAQYITGSTLTVDGGANA
jgi:Enoyl-(Acyl carrier protein) reductase